MSVYLALFQKNLLLTLWKGGVGGATGNLLPENDFLSTVKVYDINNIIIYIDFYSTFPWNALSKVKNTLTGTYHSFKESSIMKQFLIDFNCQLSVKD